MIAFRENAIMTPQYQIARWHDTLSLVKVTFKFCQNILNIRLLGGMTL